MKKVTITCFVLGIFLIGLSLYFGIIGVKYPPRPKNLTEEYFWAGGADGGCWFKLEHIEKNKYYCKIYSEAGKILIEGFCFLSSYIKNNDTFLYKPIEFESNEPITPKNVVAYLYNNKIRLTNKLYLIFEQ